MCKFSSFLKDALCSDSSVSSKRIAGFVGWVVCLVCVCYSIFTKTEPTSALDPLFISSTALLGLDSVVSIFKK